MHMLHLRFFTAPSPIVKCSVNPKSGKPSPSSISLPARDRVIDFGKYRGKMLGSLPSPYLQWISKTLRAGDTEPWARMADQVLSDPVYKDRIEWEFAEKVLHGDVKTTSDSPSSVEALAEISERFGWDNEDKIAWSRVDFGLLGTSRGGRIPRIKDKAEGSGVGKDDKLERWRGSLGKVGENERRRQERRQRRVKGSLGNSEVSNGGSGGEKAAETAARIYNPFPGRESLLKKAMMSRQKGL